MKYIALFITLFAIAMAYEDMPHEAQYFESVLNNESAMMKLIGCVLDKNPCDDFSQHAKSHLIESWTDGCNECDATQKHYARVFDEAFKNEKYKTLLEEVKAKYDPDGKLLMKFEEKIKGY